jgi:hypothetical protein
LPSLIRASLSDGDRVGYPEAVKLSTAAHLTPGPDAQVKSLNDGGVIVDTRTGKCWELNAVGFAIWQQIAAGKTLAETAEAVAARYSISTVTSADDVLAFAQSLLREGLLELPAGTDPDAATG